MHQAFTRVAIGSLLLCLSFSLSGQDRFKPGYVITASNDTLKGDIAFNLSRSVPENIRFRGQNRVVEYNALDLKEFSSRNRLFSSQIIQGEFVEVLIIGKINLFRSNQSFYVKKDEEILELSQSRSREIIDGQGVLREDQTWRRNLSRLISDCLPNPDDLALSTDYSERSLNKLVNRYNSCVSNNTVDIKGDLPWSKVNFGLSVGYTMSSVSFTHEGNSNPNLEEKFNSGSPTAGLTFMLSFPRLSEVFYLQTDLLYSHFTYNSTVSLSTSIFDTSFETETLSIPIGIGYKKPLGNLALDINLGINIDSHINSSSSVLSESISGNTINTNPEREAFIINGSQTGFWLGAGILKEFKLFTGAFAVRYTSMPNMVDSSQIESSNSRLSFHLNFYR